MSIFLTIFAGVITFVAGQFFLRLVIEPIHELKRTISEIAVAIIQHANVYCNPGVTGEDREKAVSEELRQLASKLNAQMYLVPAYNRIYRFFGMPSRNNISKALRYLIGISNSVHKSAASMATINAEKSDQICDLLGIHMPDEDRALRKENESA